MSVTDASPAAVKTVSLTIDGVPVTVPEGTLLVEAAKTVSTDIPVYCYHPKLGPAGLCRICLVAIDKMPKLQIACNTVATEGMAVHTYGDKVDDGRRAVLEFLLLNHPLDCPICDKGGECDLQDFSMAYGQGASRLADPKASKPKAIDLGPTIVLDDERCIVCQRCSRFDEIITNERSLVVKERGQRDVIATASGAPYVSDFSGNVTELCPVGALTSKTYRFKSRPWDNHRTQTTCTQCSVGCQMYVDVRHGDVLRTMSVPTDDAHSDGWLCDRGRYNIAFYDDPGRLSSPVLREGDTWVEIDWDDAIALWAKHLREALAEGGPASLGVIGGGRLLNEEAFLLQAVFRSLGIANLDWRAGRQRHATPAASLSGTYADLAAAQSIIVLGRPPAQSAPVMDLRIRKVISQRTGRLYGVGPFSVSGFVPEAHVARFADLPSEAFEADRIAVVWDGIDETLGADAMRALGPLVASGRKISTFIPGEQANARGAEAMGMRPAPGGVGTDDMFAAARDGKMRVLSLFGVNPVLNYRDRDLVTAALRATPFVVLSDLFVTETAKYASLILPARGAFEKTGHVCDLTGVVIAVNASVEAPLGPLSDGDMLIALADEMNVAVPTPADLTAAATQPAADVQMQQLSAAPAETGDANAVRVAIGTRIFAGGGTVMHDVRVRPLVNRPLVTLAPKTAAKLDLVDGDMVTLAAGERTLSGLEVTVQPSAVEGFAMITDSLSAAPANVFLDGEAVTMTRSSKDLRERVLR